MEEPTITVEEAIVAMKTGTTMLKCGRTGSPHFRTFVLSDDMNVLSWASPKKKSIDSKGKHKKFSKKSKKNRSLTKKIIWKIISKFE